MSNLTTKELAAIEDQLSMEQTLVRKYQSYSQQCTDVQIKNKCEQIAGKHQAHYDRLLSHLS